MSIRLLIIDDQLKIQIARIVDWSSKHYYIPGESARPPGDNPRHVLKTEYGFRCVFSFTAMQGKIFRDLSVSVSTKGKFPNEFAFYTLAQLFGFTGWDGKTIVPPPEGWMMAKDIDYDAIRVAQEVV